MHQQPPNMHPYYNQPANPMQSSAGVNYHDANYHDMQANRYETFNQFYNNFERHVNDVQNQCGYVGVPYLLNSSTMIPYALKTVRDLRRFGL